jgi:hypothetical protein
MAWMDQFKKDKKPSKGEKPAKGKKAAPFGGKAALFKKKPKKK